jgi:hypothetical protein
MTRKPAPIVHVFWIDARGNFRSHDFQLRNGRLIWYTPRLGGIEDSYQRAV